MIEFNDNFDNVENENIGGSSTLSEGWHKLELREVGDVRRNAKGTCQGALFTFGGVDGSFKLWLCVKAETSDALWMERKFKVIMHRIAQCVGVENLRSTDDLIGKPFYANVTAREREYATKDVDIETGAPIMRKTIDNNFRNGKAGEVFLSCADYAAKHANFPFQFNK